MRGDAQYRHRGTGAGYQSRSHCRQSDKGLTL